MQEPKQDTKQELQQGPMQEPVIQDPMLVELRWLTTLTLNDPDPMPIIVLPDPTPTSTVSYQSKTVPFEIVGSNGTHTGYESTRYCRIMDLPPKLTKKQQQHQTIMETPDKDKKSSHQPNLFQSAQESKPGVAASTTASSATSLSSRNTSTT